MHGKSGISKFSTTNMPAIHVQVKSSSDVCRDPLTSIVWLYVLISTIPPGYQDTGYQTRRGSQQTATIPVSANR
ncbi:hypothetical protein BDZ89DRAFT_1067382 [Hymenopellis radicata]|nr:hypothetical protein BDZ89DRAFT_1067382 [Hymenopellis radicata]